MKKLSFLPLFLSLLLSVAFLHCLLLRVFAAVCFPVTRMTSRSLFLSPSLVSLYVLLVMGIYFFEKKMSMAPKIFPAEFLVLLAGNVWCHLLSSLDRDPTYSEITGSMSLSMRFVDFWCRSSQILTESRIGRFRGRNIIDWLFLSIYSEKKSPKKWRHFPTRNFQQPEGKSFCYFLLSC